MHCVVAASAQRDQILLRVVPALTAKLSVVNVEVA